VGGAALSVLGSNRTYVGTNWDGTIAVPNGQFGVWIENGARSNLVGYSSRPDVISGNNWGGVAIVGSGTRNNGIRNTYIGTNAAGTAPLGNGTGVFVGQGATLNGIGGSAASQRNVISGNRDYGIILTDFGTRLNHVRGNLIGTNRDGLAAIPNQKDGVWIGNGASENHIGFTFPGTGNIISGNYWSGVALFHRGTIGNTIQGNYIGTTVAGDAPLGNGGAGVWIAQEASSNVIGGSTTGARNVIAAHYYAPGVMIRDVSTHSNVVKGNYIGTNAAGNAALGNNQGVQVALGASFNTIKGNLISGNLGEGVALIDARTVRNAVLGNVIGLTAAGTALGNYDGVSVTQGANGNYIGGAEVGAGNVIARNMRHGVVLQGYGTSYNYVQGNFIRHNADSGILIASAASANIIGGSLPGEANTITGNRRNGIRTVAVGRRNLIRGNSIYANGALGIDINSNGVTLAHTVKLTEAVTSNTGTTITGQVIGAPNATYTVELFASADADPSGFGEGERPLPGLYTVTTDGNGNGYFRVTLRSSLTVGYFVSSTATEADGTTWEFGNSLRVRGV
jgi:titin